MSSGKKVLQFYKITVPIPTLFHNYFTEFVHKYRADFIMRRLIPLLPQRKILPMDFDGENNLPGSILYESVSLTK